MITLATMKEFGVWIDSSDGGLDFTIEDDDGSNLVFDEFVYEKDDEDGSEYLEVPALWQQGNKSYSEDRCVGWFHSWKEAMAASKQCYSERSDIHEN